MLNLQDAANRNCGDLLSQSFPLILEGGEQLRKDQRVFSFKNNVAPAHSKDNGLKMMLICLRTSAKVRLHIPAIDATLPTGVSEDVQNKEPFVHWRQSSNWTCH